MTKIWEPVDFMFGVYKEINYNPWKLVEDDLKNEFNNYFTVLYGDYSKEQQGIICNIGSLGHLFIYPISTGLMNGVVKFLKVLFNGELSCGQIRYILECTTKRSDLSELYYEYYFDNLQRYYNREQFLVSMHLLMVILSYIIKNKNNWENIDLLVLLRNNCFKKPHLSIDFSYRNITKICNSPSELEYIRSIHKITDDFFNKKVIKVDIETMISSIKTLLTIWCEYYDLNIEHPNTLLNIKVQNQTRSVEYNSNIQPICPVYTDESDDPIYFVVKPFIIFHSKGNIDSLSKTLENDNSFGTEFRQWVTKSIKEFTNHENYK